MKIKNNTNKISLNELKNITIINEIKNIDKNIIFDYMRILIDKKDLKESDNVLYFPITLGSHYVEEGWISQEIDQRLKINKLINSHPKYIFVVEESMLEMIENKQSKFIIVPNIMNMIEDISKYIISKSRAEIIEITGSVGKTTTAGLIEKVVAEKYNVLRFYQKRITPILMHEFIINNINKKIDYVVTEISLFYRDHVSVLSSILKPNISVILNIDSSHIHNDGMDTLKDLCLSKSKILKYSSLGFINQKDNQLNKLKFLNNYLFYEDEKLFETNLKRFIALNITTDPAIKLINKFLEENNHSYYISELSLIQLLVTYKIGKELDIEDKEIFKAIKEYVPVENRLQIKTIFNKKIFFDGDITTLERMRQISKHRYKDIVLIIRKFGSAEILYSYDGILELLTKFTKVYLFSDIEYLSLLSKSPNAVIVENHDFMNNINGKLIYHYSGYYRSFDTLKEENLIKIENTIYKIVTPKEDAN